MEFLELLSRLGEKAGLPGLAPDDHGTCRLALDDIAIDLKVTGDKRHLLLFGEVVSLPFERRETLVRHLLGCNHRFSENNGATLGLDVESNVLYLQQQEALDCLDEDAFEKILESFVNTIEKWKNYIGEFQQSTDDDSSEQNEKTEDSLPNDDFAFSASRDFLRV